MLTKCLFPNFVDLHIWRLFSVAIPTSVVFYILAVVMEFLLPIDIFAVLYCCCYYYSLFLSCNTSFCVSPSSIPMVNIHILVHGGKGGRGLDAGYYSAIAVHDVGKCLSILNSPPPPPSSPPPTRRKVYKTISLTLLSVSRQPRSYQ
jgi:hypothetical protein